MDTIKERVESTKQKHENFVEQVNRSMHCKLNSNAHKDGLIIEIGQYSKMIGDYKTNGYWYNENVKVLVFGNDKIQFYFKKDRLWDWIVENKHRISHFLDNKVKGISISIKEAHMLSDMTIK